MDEVAQPVAIGFDGGEDSFDLALVLGGEDSSGGVGEHFFYESAGDLFLLFEHELFHVVDVMDGGAIGEGGGGINFQRLVTIFVVGAPEPEFVGIFEGEAGRVDFSMALEA